MTEIITKAIVGSSKVCGSEKYTLTPSVKPNAILGCWIINHKTTTKLDLDTEEIILNDSFEINLWYSYNNNTQTTVFSEKIEYQERLDFILNESVLNMKELDTIINCYKEPTVTDPKILDDGRIQVYISEGIQVELVGEVRVKIEEEKEDE